jgi:hypothetical protein
MARSRKFILPLIASVFVAACSGKTPSIPLPAEAVQLRTPRDIDGAWLDVQEQKLRLRLEDHFGPVDIAEYRLDTWTWDTVYRQFDTALTGQSLQRFKEVPERSRHYRLAVWSRNGRASRPMVALAEVMPPYSSSPSHRVVLVITPRE